MQVLRKYRLIILGAFFTLGADGEYYAFAITYHT